MAPAVLDRLHAARGQFLERGDEGNHRPAESGSTRVSLGDRQEDEICVMSRIPARIRTVFLENIRAVSVSRFP